MITDVDRWAPGYAELGAFSVTFHAEATDDPSRSRRKLRQIGARAGLALKPGTPIEPYLELLPEFDQLLVMTVEPGFGGQSFMRRRCSRSSAPRARSSSARRRVAVAAGGRRHLRVDDRDGGGGGSRHLRRRVQRLPVGRIPRRPSTRCARSPRHIPSLTRTEGAPGIGLLDWNA